MLKPFPRLLMALASTAGMLFLGHQGVALAGSTDPTTIARKIEQDFEGFFMLTTNGGGSYSIYQRVEDGLGIPAAADIVCMQHECFLEIAEVPASALERDGADGRGIQDVRWRFKAVRDAYRAMRAADTAGRPEAERSWEEAMASIAPCIEDTDRC